MIWPFRPHPPLPLASKVTCERRFATVGKLLGTQRLIGSHSIVAPQDIDALIADHNAESLLRTLFGFVASRILPGKSVDVSWGSEEDMSADGETLHYRLIREDETSPFRIEFHPAMADAPYQLAALIANASAEFLIRSGPLTETVSVGTFEVLPLFYGFGPVMANAALREHAETLNPTQRWEMSRVGTVSPLEFGYTMALSDWAMDTSYESVRLLLRPDAKEGLEKGIRFLSKTLDSCFDQDFLERTPDSSIGFVTSQLESRSDSVQLSTLLNLYASPQVDGDLLPPIARLLGHSELEIQRLATATMGRCETIPQPIHDELLILAENAPALVRRTAVASLRPGYDNDEQIAETLTELLRRGDAGMAATCVRTLLKYDTFPEHLPESLMSGLSTMVLTVGNDDLSAGVQLLRKIHDDPSQVVMQHFEDDPSARAIFDEILNPEMKTALPDE